MKKVIQHIREEILKLESEIMRLDNYRSSKAISYLQYMVSELEGAESVIIEVDAIKRSCFDAETYDGDRKTQRLSILEEISKSGTGGKDGGSL